MTSDRTETLSEAPQCVLLIEGSVLTRLAIARYLRDCGYKVIETADADAAMQVLAQSGIDIDLVLAGVELPGTTNGFTLSRWIRDHRPDIRVMLSGSASASARTAAMMCEEGPEGGRPYDPRVVLDEIKRLLASRS